MVAWAYDSYCTDNVFETVNDIIHTQDNIDNMVIDVFEQILPDYPTETDLEFLIGIVIWCLRSNFTVKLDYLNISYELCNYLIDHGIFNDWFDKDKRKKKLIFEKKFLKKILKGEIIEDNVLKTKNNKIVNKHA